MTIYVFRLLLVSFSFSPSCIAESLNENPALLLSTLNGFRNITFGKRLKNSIIDTVYKKSLLECVQACLKRSRCLSINYHSRNLQCELNKMSERQNQQEYKQNKNFVYSSMEFWSQKILDPPCDKKLCGKTEYCDTASGDCIISDCGEPTSLKNAVSHGDGLGVGRSNFYFCNENYKLSGDNRITCSENGTWSSIQATCNSVECGDPPIHPHATSSGSGTTYGHIYTYTCNNGYKQSGISQVRCNKDGKWSEPLFNCTTEDCASLYEAGVRKNGVYEITPNAFYRFNVYCDMNGAGWIVINRRVDGVVNFDRDWNDYLVGFGDHDADFWLGLTYIHLLTTRPNYIMFTFLMEKSGKVATAFYSNFKIAGEDDKFRMAVDPNGVTNSEMAQYIVNDTDGFYYHNGMQFTTIDNDNDQFKGNCANYSKFNLIGGFWYRACIQLASFNSIFSDMNIFVISDGYRFIKSEVKIRRMDVLINENA